MWDGILGIFILVFFGVVLISKVFIIHSIIAIALILLTPVVISCTIVEGITTLWNKCRGHK